MRPSSNQEPGSVKLEASDGGILICRYGAKSMVAHEVDLYIDGPDAYAIKNGDAAALGKYLKGSEKPGRYTLQDCPADVSLTDGSFMSLTGGVIEEFAPYVASANA